MAIRCRPMRHKDIPECVEILARHPVLALRYGETISLLGEVWSRLLGKQSFDGVLCEETNGKCFRKVALGIRAFLSDTYMAAIKTSPHIWTGPDLIRRICAGQSPLLSDKEAREANANGGLNLFIWEGALSANDQGRPEAMHALLVEFVNQHRGFHLKELIAQSSDVNMMEAQLQSGGYLLNESGQYTKTLPRPIEEVANAPHFVGLTRELALQQYGSWVSSLFVFEPPRFGLRPSEQRLLLAALEGGTDEQIAERLALSLSAVKKTWLQIYERIAACDPHLVPNSLGEKDQPERGKTKKQRLLAYLHEHMQEVRPLASRM